MRRASLALLAILLLAAPALADHVYSHRYVVVGRVVAADGTPLAGETVLVTLEGFDGVVGWCQEDGREGFPWLGRFELTTDADGAFRACLHMDSGVREGAILRVSARNATAEAPADPRHRETYVPLVLEDAAAPANGGAPAPRAANYTVRGVVWRPAEGGTTLEGIPVEGVALGGVPVDVRLRARDGTEVAARVATDLQYGWYEVVFQNVTLPPEGAEVLVEAMGVRVATPADPVARFSHVHVDDAGGLARHVVVPLALGGFVVAAVATRWGWSLARRG